MGIGTGDWDDYLGYWLRGNGDLISIDNNRGICELFEYRQKREGHPNPSNVMCKSIFDPDLPKGKFDIVTIIGSAINETGDFHKCLNSCFNLLKTGRHMMFMANLRRSPVEMLEQYISSTNYFIEHMELFEAFPEYPFFICKIRKD